MSVVMTFNSVTSTTMGLTIIDVQKPIMPPQNETTIDIPKYPGITQFSKKFINNTITVKGVLIGTSTADLVTKLEALGAYLYSDTDKTLSFDDQTDRDWQAQHIDTVIVARTYRFCFLDLIFKCNDPFAYDTTPTTDSQNITVKDTTYVVANGGQYYAYPTVTITFNATQTHVYVANNSISGNRFDISKAFQISDVLVIDCKNGTIKLNGVNSPAGFGDGGLTLAEWIILATGNNSLQVGTDDATINITIALSFDKPYLY